jgi:hypothetical protein
VSSCWRHLPPM